MVCSFVFLYIFPVTKSVTDFLKKLSHFYVDMKLMGIYNNSIIVIL